MREKSFPLLAVALVGIVALTTASACGGSDAEGRGSGGKVRTDFGSKEYASVVAIQDDGKIIAAGESTASRANEDDPLPRHHVALTRYTTDGRLDPSFGTGGRVRTSLGWIAGARAVAVQASGKIIVAGAAGRVGSTDFALARFTPSGKLDPSFGVGE